MKGMKSGTITRASGRKQFAGSGSAKGMAITPKKATAAMLGTEMPSEAPAKSIARKSAKKNTFKSGGRKVF